MLSSQGFDLWADNYDQTVLKSEESNVYPFAGYRKILNVIYNEAMQKQHSDVLDIGFGTGILASKLYEKGHRIDGIDFSPQMMSIAQPKMPDAHLIHWDISKGIPPEILGNKYDSIISTYTLHHLTDTEKVSFINQLIPLLNENGNIFIGDVAFETNEQMNECKDNNFQHWDEDEFYFVNDVMQDALSVTCEFHPISHCGGIFIIPAG